MLLGMVNQGLISLKLISDCWKNFGLAEGKEMTPPETEYE